jgi:hypothetical protein
MFKAIVVITVLGFPSPIQLDDEKGPYEDLPECWVRAAKMIKDFVAGPMPVMSVNSVCISLKSTNINH